MVLVVTGLARESQIAAGPDVTRVVCSGSNPNRLRSELAGVDIGDMRAVISFGIAGGLDPALRPGDVVVASAVISEAGVWKVPAKILAAITAQVSRHGIHATNGFVVGVEEPIIAPASKTALRRETNAAAVDMESHIGAAYAASKGLPFAAIRVISDPAERALPELAKKALKPDGRIDVPAVVAGLAHAPLQLATLIRAGGDAGRAFAGLRRCRGLLDFGLGFGLADL
jgi:adenosylhomocysteine nucleosidase